MSPTVTRARLSIGVTDDTGSLLALVALVVVVAWARGAYANLTGAHYGHGHEVVIDSANEAHGIVAMEDYVFGPDRKTELFHAAGHYDEKYRIEDGVWRIAEMKITRLFIASKMLQPDS